MIMPEDTDWQATAWRWLARSTLIIGGIGLGILFGLELDVWAHGIMR